MVLKRLIRSRNSENKKNRSVCSNKINSNNTKKYYGTRTIIPNPIMRVISVDDSLHRKGLAPPTRDMNDNTSITFGQVIIRDYERVAGDNPSVTRGVPIGLGWTYVEYDGIALDDYEEFKPRRTKAELVMTAQVRESILKKEWNVSQKEIASAVRKSIKAKNHRRNTVLEGDLEDQFLHKIKENMTRKVRNWKHERRAKSSLSACSKSSDNDEDSGLDQQKDYMDSAANMSQQYGSLDGTRHKDSLNIAIEPEEDEDNRLPKQEQVSSSFTADMTSDDFCWATHSTSIDSRSLIITP